MAEVLGKPGEQKRFEARADTVRHAFNHAFFDSEAGVYDQGSQTAQAMPLVLGLVPPGPEADAS